jgi:hypothetical protein
LELARIRVRPYKSLTARILYRRHEPAVAQPENIIKAIENHLVMRNDDDRRFLDVCCAITPSSSSPMRSTG